MNAPLTNAADGLARRAFTVAEVERMVELGVIAPDERFEILGGEIVPMSPKGNRHETLKVALARRWGKQCPEDCTLAQETGLRLSDYMYMEPDFLVFSRRVALASVLGPDILLAVEIADSSLDYDLHQKSRIYAAHGVRELWVIDAGRRCTHIHLGPGLDGYAWVVFREKPERLEPTYAPREFALALDDLEPV